MGFSPWQSKHFIFDSGIVSNIKLKGFVTHPSQLLRDLITKQHSCLCPGGQRLKLDKFTYGAIIELWKSWQTTTGHVSHGTWIHLTSIKGAACQRRRLTFYTSGSAFALPACLLLIQQNTENRPLGPDVQGAVFVSFFTDEAILALPCFSGTAFPGTSGRQPAQKQRGSWRRCRGYSLRCRRRPPPGPCRCSPRSGRGAPP